MPAGKTDEPVDLSIMTELISKEIASYCKSHSSEEPPFLKELDRATNLSQVYPRMLSGHLQGTLLRMISMMIRPERILEIGTFTGYSAICLAQGLAPGGKIHTIEVDPELEEMIRDFFGKAGISDLAELHIGPAENIIPSLGEEWDLVFIDADKPNYLTYYQMVFPSLKQGGFILADNALWDGKVTEESNGDKDTIGIKEFNEFVQKDKRVENFLLPFRDGLMIIRKL